jgi:hypothetical protein
MKDVFPLVIVPLVLAEVLLVGPWLAERLLRWGTRWLPEEDRERYVADWVGELDAVPGSLFKLGFAIRVLVNVPATQRALTARDAIWVLAAKRLLALGIAGLALALVAVSRLGRQQVGNPVRPDTWTWQVKERWGRRPAPWEQRPPAPSKFGDLRPLKSVDGRSDLYFDLERGRVVKIGPPRDEEQEKLQRLRREATLVMDLWETRTRFG